MPSLFESDLDLAYYLSTGSYDLLKKVSEITADQLANPDSLGDLGDAISQKWIEEQLAIFRPNDYVLSEEASDNKNRINADKVWVIDPLDGTNQYKQKNPEWAVHIGIWTKNEDLQGVVTYQDHNHEIKTYRSDQVPQVKGKLTNILVSSRSRDQELTQKIVTKLGMELKRIGSAGTKTMTVVSGLADAYVHSGGQYEWDCLAPIAIAKAAGLHCSRTDGSEFIFNQSNPFVHDLLICRKEIASDLMRVIND